MCGRFALGLRPSKICKLCRFKRDLNKKRYMNPKWVDLVEKEFKPSYNIRRGMLCAVMILEEHLKSEEDNDENRKRKLNVQ